MNYDIYDQKRRCYMSEKDLFDEIARIAYELWEKIWLDSWPRY
jgi:hypothetical protein